MFLLQLLSPCEYVCVCVCFPLCSVSVLWPLWCPSGTCCSSPLTWWGPCGRSRAPAPPRKPGRRGRTCAPSSGPTRSSASPAGPAARPPDSPHGPAPESHWTDAGGERGGRGVRGQHMKRENYPKICMRHEAQNLPRDVWGWFLTFSVL